MELEELIITYIHNPSEEIRAIIDSKIEKRSVLKIMASLKKVKLIADKDSQYKDDYYKIIEEIINKIKNYKPDDYKLDESGRLRPISKK